DARIGDLRGLSPAFPPDHDDHHGGDYGYPADRPRRRRRLRAAPPAWSRRRRRALRLAAPDALHHPRRLPLHGAGAEPLHRQGQGRGGGGGDRRPRGRSGVARRVSGRGAAVIRNKASVLVSFSLLFRPFFSLSLLVLACPAPAAAQRLPAVEADHYARCMDETRRNPGGAWDGAPAWRDAGGGHPAEHCAAVALIGLKQYDEAGKRLEKLADEMFKAPPELRAQVIGQAAQARLLGGDPTRAVELLTQALAITPQDRDLMTDRAEAYAAGGKYREAIGDLDKALAADPRRIDPLVFPA